MISRISLTESDSPSIYNDSNNIQSFHIKQDIRRLNYDVTSPYWNYRWNLLTEKPKSFSDIVQNSELAQLVMEGCLLPYNPSFRKKRIAKALLLEPELKWAPEFISKVITPKKDHSLFHFLLEKELRKRCSDPLLLTIFETRVWKSSILKKTIKNMIPCDQDPKKILTDTSATAFLIIRESPENFSDTTKKILDYLIEKRMPFFHPKDACQISRNMKSHLPENYKEVLFNELCTEPAQIPLYDLIEKADYMWRRKTQALFSSEHIRSIKELNTREKLHHIIKGIITFNGSDSLLKDIWNHFGEFSLMTALANTDWKTLDQLISRISLQGMSINYPLWNRLLSQKAVSGFSNTVEIEQIEIERNPQGVLRTMYRNPLINRFSIKINGEYQPSIDAGGVSKFVFSKLLGNLNGDPDATPSKAFPVHSFERKDTERKEAGREHIISLSKVKDGYIPGAISLESPSFKEQIVVYEEIARLLKLSLNNFSISTGPVFSLRVYNALLKFTKKEIKEDFSLISDKKARVIFEILYPEESYPEINEMNSDEEIVKEFMKTFSEEGPPEEVDGWEISKKTISSLRKKKKLEFYLRLLKSKQEELKKESLKRVQESIRPIYIMAKEISTSQVVEWDFFRHIDSKALSNQIEGCRDISEKTILSRLNWGKNLPETTKKWLKNWLGQKPTESEEEHLKRLTTWVESISGVKALPNRIQICLRKVKGWPFCSTCFEWMEIPTYDSEEEFIRNMDQSQKYLSKTMGAP